MVARQFAIVVFLSILSVIATANHGSGHSALMRTEHRFPPSRIYNREPRKFSSRKASCKTRRRKYCPVNKRHRALLDDAFRWQNAIVPYELGNICVNLIWEGRQEIDLGSNCEKGDILHELMHTLGFEHEHARLDRDQYVRIIWDNIDPEGFGQFQIENGCSNNTFETKLLAFPYSFSSIMHYEDDSFSKNGNRTIEPLEHFNLTGIAMGAMEGLDQTDIDRVRALYECRGKESMVRAAVAHKCVSTEKGSVRHGQIVPYNGYLYKCHAEIYEKDTYLPYACMNTTGHRAFAEEEYIDGEYRFLCKFNSTSISKLCVACLPSLGIVLGNGETWIDGNISRKCFLTSEGNCQLRPVACVGDKGESVTPGNEFLHRGTHALCYQNGTEIGYRYVDKLTDILNDRWFY